MHELTNIRNGNLVIAEDTFFTIKWQFDGKYFTDKKLQSKFGYSEDEISTFPEFHYALINDFNFEEFKDRVISLSDNEKLRIDYDLMSKNGKIVCIREFVEKINIDKDIYFLSTLFDVSEFKQKEIELNEKIENKQKLNDSKDNLISIISHDLRAPFSSLLGFSEILMNEPNLSTEERNEYLQYIFEASEIQLKMVNHLLDWTRLQTGTIKYDPRRIDVKDVIDNCISILTGSSMRKNIEIKNEAVSGYFVYADERLLNQVITNLLSNAVKFTPAGKKITVSVDLYKENMVEVIVADEGKGIDESNHDKLFKIDSKFTEQGTAGEKGTGFGLTVVKEIVKKHNGDIWFYSELNKGSEFHFTLPRAKDSILIIEEHSELRANYKKIFDKSHQNYTIEFVNNGFEALNAISSNLPALIIIYHNMPMLSGLQLVTSLRSKDTHHYVKIITIVNQLTDEEKASYNSLNVDEFIPIEASDEELEKIIDRLLA